MALENVVAVDKGRVISSGSSGGGGLTQEEHDWLESVAKMPNYYDINPEKQTVNGFFRTNVSSFGTLPVLGYDKIALYQWASYYVDYRFNYKDGSTDSSFTGRTTRGAWTNYIQIPENANEIYFSSNSGTESYAAISYSLLTADSPYNPDNQTS